jgi:hypothetical protein
MEALNETVEIIEELSPEFEEHEEDDETDDSEGQREEVTPSPEDLALLRLEEKEAYLAKLKEVHQKGTLRSQIEMLTLPTIRGFADELKEITKQIETTFNRTLNLTTVTFLDNQRATLKNNDTDYTFLHVDFKKKSIALERLHLLHFLKDRLLMDAIHIALDEANEKLSDKKRTKAEKERLKREKQTYELRASEGKPNGTEVIKTERDMLLAEVNYVITKFEAEGFSLETDAVEPCLTYQIKSAFPWEEKKVLKEGFWHKETELPMTQPTFSEQTRAIAVSRGAAYPFLQNSLFLTFANSPVNQFLYERRLTEKEWDELPHAFSGDDFYLDWTADEITATHEESGVQAVFTKNGTIALLESSRKRNTSFLEKGLEFLPFYQDPFFYIWLDKVARNTYEK